MAQIHETFVTVDRLTYADGMFPLFRGQCGSPHDAVGGSQAVFAALIGDFSVVYIDDFVSDALQIAGDVVWYILIAHILIFNRNSLVHFHYMVNQPVCQKINQHINICLLVLIYVT